MIKTMNESIIMKLSENGRMWLGFMLMVAALLLSVFAQNIFATASGADYPPVPLIPPWTVGIVAGASFFLFGKARKCWKQPAVALPATVLSVIANIAVWMLRPGSLSTDFGASVVFMGLLLALAAAACMDGKSDSPAGRKSWLLATALVAAVAAVALVDIVLLGQRPFWLPEGNPTAVWMWTLPLLKYAAGAAFVLVFLGRTSAPTPMRVLGVAVAVLPYALLVIRLYTADVAVAAPLYNFNGSLTGVLYGALLGISFLRRPKPALARQQDDSARAAG